MRRAGRRDQKGGILNIPWQRKETVMSQHEVVLVGVEGSAAALHALDWAVGRAKRLGWKLHIVCAYSLPSFSAASLDGGYAALDDSAIHQGAQAVLDEALERVKGRRVARTASLEAGDAAR